MIRRPPRSTQSRSSAASDVYKRQMLCGSELHQSQHWVSLHLEHRLTTNMRSAYDACCRHLLSVREGTTVIGRSWYSLHPCATRIAHRTTGRRRTQSANADTCRGHPTASESDRTRSDRLPEGHSWTWRTAVRASITVDFHEDCQCHTSRHLSLIHISEPTR